jgi:hypothetical protein
MRQATLGGVGICHAMREKCNLLSYWDFLAGCCRPHWPVTVRRSLPWLRD